jgi:outer membrane protein TolC
MLAVLGFSCLYPEESAGGQITLAELVETALQQNTQIQAAKKEWQASLHKIPQVRALPDPVLSFARFGQSIETRLGPQRNKISVSQQIPFFGKQGIKGEVASRHSDVLENQYESVKADVIMKVKEAYFSLYLIDRSIQVVREEKEVFRQLSTIAAKKYETGQVGQQDALKAQLAISHTTDKLLAYHRVRHAVVSELNHLMNRKAESPIEETEDFSIPDVNIGLEQLIDWARENRPELRKAQAVIQKNEENLKLVKKDFYPDFRLMLDYIDIGAGSTVQPDDGRNAWMASVGINIPLWRKKLHAAEAEAVLRIRASEDLYENTQSETISRIHSVYFDMETARDQLDHYRFSLMPQAEQALKASEVGYQAGKVDFLDLLESERMVLMVKNGYFKILSDFGKSLARLERLTGKNLLDMNGL